MTSRSYSSPQGALIMRIVLIGLPGAGKGTQGILLSERCGVPHISTGSIFRLAKASGSELGREAARYIDRGELVPDELATAIVAERLRMDDCRNGFILDGFPRTVNQARALDSTLSSDSPLSAVVDICITEETAVRRIAERRFCQRCGATYHRTYLPAKGDGVCDECGGPLGRRADDTVETAKRRLKIFEEETAPVIDYYRDRGMLVTVNGEQGVEEVQKEIIAKLRRAGVRCESYGVTG